MVVSEQVREDLLIVTMCGNFGRLFWDDLICMSNSVDLHSARRVQELCRVLPSSLLLGTHVHAPGT